MLKERHKHTQSKARRCDRILPRPTNVIEFTYFQVPGMVSRPFPAKEDEQIRVAVLSQIKL